VVTVRELRPDEVEGVGRHLPLSRLTQQADERSTYLVAWDDTVPVGHAHIAWTGTHLGLPEIQDVFVLPELRRRGIASQLTHAAEAEARARGWDRVSLSVSQDGNPAASRLYAKLDYADAGVEPVRVLGQVMLRTGPLDVDDRSSTSSRSSEARAKATGRFRPMLDLDSAVRSSRRRHADPGAVNTIRD
jgi:GNAT superfamily N-acetyltransferase